MKLESADKILILRLSSLGDILLSTPLVRSIKKRYPSIRMDFLLREEFKDALRLNPHIDNLIFFTNNKTDEIKKKIRQEKYPVIIDLQNNLRSAGLLEKCVSEKIRFRKRDISKFLLVKFKINLLKSALPIAERYASGINGFALDGDAPELFTDKTASQVFKPDYRYIGIAPGAKHFTKRWPSDYYIELGRKLVSDGFRIVFFGGKDDKDVCERISGSVTGSVNLANENDLLQISADMKKCLAVVCNDSGLMHTASASGVPVTAIFGSTVKEFGFAPYKTSYRIAENSGLPCRPCSHIGRKSCPKEHFKCMNEVTPVMVYENIIALLSQ